MNLNYFGIHNHTEMSNLRLLDSIIKPKDLLKRGRELGFKGLCITDHDALCNHIEVNQMAQEIWQEDPEFKVGLGNEIYLCGNRDPGQKYFHFILIAKNAMGHKALRELSSRAWLNVYVDRGMERVVTTYDDLVEIYNKYPNSLIGTTACLGGELSTAVNNLIDAEQMEDTATAAQEHQHIVNFVLWCKDLFGDDFYIECAPACSAEQIRVNKRLLSIAQCFGIKLVAGADAHYLRKEDRFVHSAYLTSKPGNRETDSFYEYAYLQTTEEMVDHLTQSYGIDDIDKIFANSMDIYDKIENYSLLHAQQIPKVEVKNYPKKDFEYKDHYPNLQRMFQSDDQIERYWVNQCWDELYKKAKETPIHLKTYLDELEEEADVKKVISDKLDTNMFSYPVVLQHYIDLIWSCGSTIGAGRGSACAALNHYLLGVTQLDPIEWNFPFFRYINRDTEGLGDIDIDICPSKRPLILSKIKEERSKNFRPDLDNLSKKNLGCTMIATFSTEATKAAILTACRGYRSDDYPYGIDVDDAQYLASLIPIDRGFLWTLQEVLHGDAEKGRKPVKTFINEANKYPGLLDIISGIEGLVRGRSCHASGVIMFDEDPYEHCCFMRTKEGEVVTQYDLHSAEAAGSTKFDFLVTSIQDKITQTIKFLQEENLIEPELSLKEAYNKYLHPNKLPIQDPATWNVIQNATSLDLFQLDSEIGRQGAKKVRPENMIELSSVNGLIRLMTAEKGAETPMEKYIRFRKNQKLWEQEMDRYGLTEENKEAIRPYLTETFGIGISQECLMRVLMDENICGFTLKEANAARKVVSKKKMDKINELHAIVEDKAVSLPCGRYVWDAVVAPQLG